MVRWLSTTDGPSSDSGLSTGSGWGFALEVCPPLLLFVQVQSVFTRTRQLILTKGDNNAVDDTTLYPEGQEFVYRENIVGLVRGYVPYVGWISLWLKESPLFLYMITTVLVVLGVVS